MILGRKLSSLYLIAVMLLTLIAPAGAAGQAERVAYRVDIKGPITVVTASDGKTYSREHLKANPMDLVYSLLVMIRAHEESDTKSKRVLASIRRSCSSMREPEVGGFTGTLRGRGRYWPA